MAQGRGTIGAMAIKALVLDIGGVLEVIRLIRCRGASNVSKCRTAPPVSVAEGSYDDFCTSDTPGRYPAQPSE